MQLILIFSKENSHNSYKYHNFSVSRFFWLLSCLAIFDNLDIYSEFILRFWMGYDLKIWHRAYFWYFLWFNKSFCEKIHFVLKIWWLKNLSSKEKIKNQLNLLTWQPRGGGSLTKIVRGCACRTSKIWLSLYQFFAKFPTHQYTIFQRKAPNLDQIGCFLQ